MLDTTTFVGLDVHARSIKAVSLDVMTGEVRCATFGYDAGAVAGWVRSVDPKASRPHGRGGVGGGRRSPAHKPVTPEAVRSEAVEANLRSLFCERPGRHTRAQTVGST